MVTSLNFDSKSNRTINADSRIFRQPINITSYVDRFVNLGSRIKKVLSLTSRKA